MHEQQIMLQTLQVGLVYFRYIRTAILDHEYWIRSYKKTRFVQKFGLSDQFFIIELAILQINVSGYDLKKTADIKGPLCIFSVFSGSWDLKTANIRLHYILFYPRIVKTTNNEGRLYLPNVFPRK